MDWETGKSLNFNDIIKTDIRKFLKFYNYDSNQDKTKLWMRVFYVFNNYLQEKVKF